MEHKKWKFYSMMFCVGILITFFIGGLLRVAVWKFCVEKWNWNNEFTKLVFVGDENTFQKNEANGDDRVDIDWQALYPFLQDDVERQEEEKKELPNWLMALSKKISVEAAKDTANTRQEKDRSLDKYIVGHQQFVTLSKNYEKFLGWNIASLSEYNGITELSDGQLVSFTKKRDVTENIHSVVNLKAYCQNMKIPFLYIQAPCKISKYDDTTISGELDFSNQNVDELLVGLQKDAVPYFDLREEIEDNKLDHHSLFFKTDHHWKPETGLWAAGRVAAFLNKNYGFHIDTGLLSLDQFDAVEYKQWFLGSRGKKATLARTVPDDIDLLYPKYPVDLTCDIPSKNVALNGDFSIMYDMKPIERRDYYGLNPYSAYNHGDSPVAILHNKRVDGKNILFIKDSFGDSMIPFLSLGVAKIEMIDRRLFSGSIERYIEVNKPDLVIVMYYPGSINPIDQKEHKSEFDFM